ncbi:MAG: isocitrate lyase, partial [Alphaproteobacteria bacterium]
MTYSTTLADLEQRYPNGAPAGINLEDLAQLKVQNTFNTHLDIARAMATVMRADMAAYDADSSKFTQSLGCWSGFHAQQM